MRLRRLFIIVILVSNLLLVCSACGPEPSPRQKTQPNDSDSMLPTTEIEEDSTAEESSEPTQALDVVMEDDFSDPDSGWEHYNHSDGVLDYEQGGYRMLVNSPENIYWVNAGLEKTDVILEVDSSFLDGPEHNWFGVICRLDIETNEYYLFAISSEGYYGIAKIVDSEIQWIQKEIETPGTMIQTGQMLNTIRASCIGNQLTLVVNSEETLTVIDEDLEFGDIGLAVATLGEPGVDILFDNLTVLQP